MGAGFAASRFLLVEETGAGKSCVFSGEKLSPVLTVYRARDFDHAQTIARSPTHSTCDCASANGDQRETAMSTKPRRLRAGTAAPSSTV